MPKTIAITGGTGLIGTALVKALAERGDRVILLSRNPDKAKSQLPNLAGYYSWDATSQNGEWTEVLSQVDAVAHLAGAPVAARWDASYKKQIYESRVVSARHLVRAMSQASPKPKAFICASGVGYYGNQGYGDDVPILDESSPAANDFLATVCVDWEKEAFEAERLGIRVVAIRTGVVLSTKGGALEKMLTPFKLFAGGPIGSGNQWVSWIHIDDEVGLWLFALDNDAASGALNATSPNPVTMRTLADALGRVLSRPSFFAVPKSALELLFGDAANVIAEGQRVVPKRALELGYRFQYPELERALRDLLTRGK
ncbi:MAG: TIGR01777 family oxidoreductase [Chloroherpetonaceae bacterium]|nr:TIGR01777 family oxidoreductase [Chloroherpetonaceae bacterium]MDW8436559.1 TIGR01777 family oxidoreductase [Chloroherpetonaceae bacterium]